MFCLSLTSRSTQNKFQDSYHHSLGATVSTALLRRCTHATLYTLLPVRSLRSSSSLSICVPLHKTSMATYRSFSSVAPNIWNALPGHLSSIPTLHPFRRCLKHHFVLRAHPGSRTPGGNSPSERITLPDTTPHAAIAPLENTMPSS